jgi:hypothetical protein
MSFWIVIWYQCMYFHKCDDCCCILWVLDWMIESETWGAYIRSGLGYNQVVEFRFLDVGICDVVEVHAGVERIYSTGRPHALSQQRFDSALFSNYSPAVDDQVVLIGSWTQSNRAYR